MDSEECSRFLIDRLELDVESVALIGHREWSTAYSFTHDGADCVIRFGKYPDDYAKDRLAASYSSTKLPIPQIIEIGETPVGFYAISRQSFGEYIDEIGNIRMRRLLPSLFAMLDGAREVELSDSTGFGIWNGDGIAPHPTWRAALLDINAERERFGGWRQKLAASATGGAPFDEAYGRMESLLACCPDERHLIHGDLPHYNVLVDGDRISAVLDWGNAMYGDFLYDIAWFAFWAPWFPAWDGIDFAAEAIRHYDAIGLRVPNVTERLRCYELHIGLDNMSYSAYSGNWTQLDEVARHTLAIAIASQ